jgi:hypothetical protein
MAANPVSGKDLRPRSQDLLVRIPRALSYLHDTLGVLID